MYLLFIIVLLLFILLALFQGSDKEGYESSAFGDTSSPSGGFNFATEASLLPQNTPFNMTPASSSTTPITNYNPANYDIQYHATAEDIQNQMDLDLSNNLINVLDASGNIIQMPFAKAPTNTTYYTSGTMKYNPANYVPNYEDTIYFSKLTGLGYQTPIENTNTQMSGFCKYDKYFPEKIEEKCNKLSGDVCATTTCCVWLGNGKCVAGDFKGPLQKAHYSDINIRNKDKYFYLGRCYGNCIDGETNDINDMTITRNVYSQNFPGFSEDNPAYLPNLSDYLAVVAPNSAQVSLQAPNITNKQICPCATAANS